MGVWDVEVAVDHSYVAHGLIHHNSRTPNLQNIPSRSAEGKRLRTLFVADPGHRLICADFSQIEPRIIASLSRDKAMLANYADGGDVYQLVADRLGVDRRIGKELVLSIAYGVGPDTIGRRTGLSNRAARELLSFFSSHFRAIGAHKAKVIADARRFKRAQTIYGRVRLLPQLSWRDAEARSKAERQAYNHTIQGSAADLMKQALVYVHDALTAEFADARLLMTVHDEVVVSAPIEVAEAVAAMVKAEMEAAGTDRLAVPLVADVGIGSTWADAKT